MPSSLDGGVRVCCVEPCGECCCVLRDKCWEGSEREFFIDDLLVRIHFIIVMIRWTGLAPWEWKVSLFGGVVRWGQAGTWRPR